MTLLFPMNISLNRCEIRIFWPHLPIVWHQEHPIWFELKQNDSYRGLLGGRIKSRTAEDYTWQFFALLIYRENARKNMNFLREMRGMRQMKYMINSTTFPLCSCADIAWILDSLHIVSFISVELLNEALRSPNPKISFSFAIKGR